MGAMPMAGINAGINAQISTRPHGGDIQSSVSLSAGASIVYPAYRLLDGTYYGDAAPTTGTWGASDPRYIKRLTPAVGQPKGYYRTVDGTPGTWVSEGNL